MGNVWQYLFLPLKNFGFEDSFISWIKRLYSDPLASVITNGQQSEYFSLGTGTRQGCNLSPFSFFSNVHHTYTRIDYFLLDNRLLGNVTSCSYHSITISDNGAVSFHMALPNCLRPPRSWRLNPLLLVDEEFVNNISSQISFFH